MADKEKGKVWYKIMIDFEEELKKYEPAIEVEQAEADIKARDLTDLTDLLFNMTAQNNGANK